MHQCAMCCHRVDELAPGTPVCHRCKKYCDNSPPIYTGVRAIGAFDVRVAKPGEFDPPLSEGEVAMNTRLIVVGSEAMLNRLMGAVRARSL